MDLMQNSTKKLGIGEARPFWSAKTFPKRRIGHPKIELRGNHLSSKRKRCGQYSKVHDHLPLECVLQNHDKGSSE
jgi:hypothetical protein